MNQGGGPSGNAQKKLACVADETKPPLYRGLVSSATQAKKKLELNNSWQFTFRTKFEKMRKHLADKDFFKVQFSVSWVSELTACALFSLLKKKVQLTW